MVHKKAISLGISIFPFIYSNYMPIKCEKVFAKRPCRTLKRWIKIISKKDTGAREFIKMWRSSLKRRLKKNIKKLFKSRKILLKRAAHWREAIKRVHHCHHHQIISHLHSTSINSFYFSLKEIKFNFLQF